MSDSFWNKEEDHFEEERETPWWSKRPVLIIFLAVVAVIILTFLWHALLPSKPQGNIDVPYVKANQEPIKVRPENPGGAEIPHKDKTVYNLIASGDTKKPTVEKLQPRPEQPLYETKFENPLELSKKNETIAVESLKPVKKVAPKKVDIFKDKNAPAPKKIKKKALGQYRIQVASMKSHKAAESEIRILKRKYSSLKGMPLDVVKATVKGRPYYRLQSGNFSTREEAFAACKKIKANGAACVVAKRA